MTFGLASKAVALEYCQAFLGQQRANDLDLPVAGVDDARTAWLGTAAAELLKRHVDVILDDGFFYREHRMQRVALAAEVGADTIIHFVEIPLDQVQFLLAELGINGGLLGAALWARQRCEGE